MFKHLLCFFVFCFCLLLVNEQQLAAQCNSPTTGYGSSNVTDTTADLFWDEDPGAVNGYEIRYAEFATFSWIYVNTPPGSSNTSISISGLVPQLTYEFDVASICGATVNPGDYTFVLERFTTTASCPTPINLLASNVGPVSADLSWDAIFEATNGYELRWREVGDPSWTSITIPAGQTTFNLSGLNSETDHEFSVLSNCGGSLGASSIWERFSTLELCGDPINLQVTNIGEMQADLQWDPVPNATAYNVQYRPTNPPMGTWIPVNGVALPYTLTGLSSGTDYEFTVQAVCPLGVGDFNLNEERFTTLGFRVEARILLEGTYNGSGQMDNSLRSLGFVPTSQPYNVGPWLYSGAEFLNPLPANIVDWVLVELRDATDETQVISEAAGLIDIDGNLIGLDGTPGLFFSGIAPDDYFILIRHRNHLDIMSSTAVNPVVNGLYDFTSGPSQVAGTNQTVDVGGGIYAMRAGDFDADGDILINDFNGYYGESSNLNGYFKADFNLDRMVSVKDFNKYQPNAAIMGYPTVTY